MPKNRVAFLELEPEGMDAEELWRLTGFVRCCACGFAVHTESLTALPEHYCSRRRERRWANPQQRNFMYDDEYPEPCGESGCHCHCASQHGPCGCDCPRDPETGDLTDDE